MIKFPKMHIARSVTNRILEIVDGLENHAPEQSQPMQPNVPDTQEQGAQLDSALAQPSPPLPGIDQAPDPGGTLAGAPLLATTLNPK